MSGVPSSISQEELLKLWVNTLSGLTSQQKEIVANAFRTLNETALV